MRKYPRRRVVDAAQMSLSPKVLKGQGLSAKSVAMRRRLIRRGLACLFIITLLALFCVWSRTEVVQLGYDIASITKETNEASKQIKELEGDIAKLKSSKRLRDIAATKLGMAPPRGDQIVFVKEGSPEETYKKAFSNE